MQVINRIITSACMKKMVKVRIDYIVYFRSDYIE